MISIPIIQHLISTFITMIKTPFSFIFSKLAVITSNIITILSPLYSFLSIFINSTTLKIVFYAANVVLTIIISDEIKRGRVFPNTVLGELRSENFRGPICEFLEMSKNSEKKDYETEKNIIKMVNFKLALGFFGKIMTALTIFFLIRLVKVFWLVELIIHPGAILIGNFIVMTDLWIPRGAETRDYRHGSERDYHDDPSRSFMLFYFYFIPLWCFCKLMEILMNKIFFS